ncbi:MAG TPA: alpha/beta fold hydrolase [Thermoleophilaceae bacterium]|nr:alpha/beta fold hydrolase [Thermoleophilaceae bacterium]
MAKSFRPSTARPASIRAARLADEGYGATAQPDWRETDWREHLHELEVAGRRVNYVDMGSGDEPPVVFVHGLGGAWQNWLENIPHVAQERRALALDLPGFGRSEMPRHEISISGYGRCVHSFCEQLGLEQVVLVGNSMGGFVAAEAAIQFPQLVERLTLVSAAGVSIANLMRRPAVTWGRVAAALGSYGAANSHAAVTRPVIRHLSLGFVMRHPTRLRTDLCWEQVHASGTPGFRDALEALLDYDFRDHLGEISCPTLIVWGKEDMMVPVKDADEFERLIPNSRKVLMDDTGHVPMLERPVKFNDCLMEFLAEPREAPRSEAEATV